MDGALAVEAFQAALAAGEPITLVLVRLYCFPFARDAC
jgi:hypothetical protein